MIAGDASFRHYHRLSGASNAILMDAPPGHEDIRPFIAVARHLAGLGYSSPAIIGADIDAGLLLLEDLGDDKFTRLLGNGKGPGETALYGAAVDLLVDLHGHAPPRRLPVGDDVSHDLPDYDDRRLLDEANLFVDWYVPALAGVAAAPALRRSFEDMWLSLFPLAHGGRPVLVLRDYHADNLMWLADRDGLARVGLLDFQDAVAGSRAYDLVSLLQDARRDVPPDLEARMIQRYSDAAGVREADFDGSKFAGAYHLLGAQRNTKIIGIFTRLWRRDGKPGYVNMIGRVWALLERDLAHPALAPAKHWFDHHVPPSMRGNALLEGIEGD